MSKKWKRQADNFFLWRRTFHFLGKSQPTEFFMELLFFSICVYLYMLTIGVNLFKYFYVWWHRKGCTRLKNTTLTKLHGCNFAKKMCIVYGYLFWRKKNLPNRVSNFNNEKKLAFCKKKLSFHFINHNNIHMVLFLYRIINRHKNHFSFLKDQLKRFNF